MRRAGWWCHGTGGRRRLLLLHLGHDGLLHPSPRRDIGPAMDLNGDMFIGPLEDFVWDGVFVLQRRSMGVRPEEEVGGRHESGRPVGLV